MQVRKLIAHGPSSLTLALPYKWVKKYNLQKGDVVSVEENDQGLRINPRPSEQKKSISINLVNHAWPAIVTVLTTVYRRGYDEVNVRYEKPEEYQHISTAVRLLLGYAITENRKGKCVIKSLPSELEQDFPTLFRRVFLILLQELDDLSEILDSPDQVSKFYHRDADLNSIVNLAIRMINKGYVANRFEELHLFHALLVLEECGDDVTRFTIEMIDNKDAPKLKTAVQECSKLLRMLYDAYFQKTGGIMDFYKQYYLYWPDVKHKPSPMYEMFAALRGKRMFYLRSIAEKTIQLAEILLLPQVEK